MGIKTNRSLELKTDLLLGLFVGSLILANTLGTKIITLFGIRVSVGVFFIPILFLVTDIIAEVYGKKKAQSFVYISVFVMIFAMIMTYISVILPPNPTWDNQIPYATVFENSLRMMFASIVAFVISQFHDVWAFDFWKRKTKGKYLWLRNNLSTIVSQLIDTIIFMFLAFYKINPKFTAGFIVSLIIPFWILKVVFAIIDTPFIYLGVRWLRKDIKKDKV